MIYTVTFNPAIDLVIRADRFEQGVTNRAASEELYFGGKGINVSVILSRLGADTTVLGFAAGFTGDALENFARGMGIKTDLIKLADGCTRINVKLKTGGCETEINASGPCIDSDSENKLFARLNTLVRGDYLVLAGSVPAGVSKDIYARIIEKCAGKGIRFAVDASGELLKKTLEYNPFLIKPNLSELEELVGKNLVSADDVAEAAHMLQSMGAVNVLVSLGDNGALLLDEHGRIHRHGAFRGTAVNTVGAGDSMLAGFLYGYHAKKNYSYALRLGSAAGGATAFSPWLAEAKDIYALMEREEL